MFRHNFFCHCCCCKFCIFVLSLYRVRQIKVIPCRVLLISQQRMRIFTQKFTQLFIIHIHVQLLNYI